MNTFNTFDKLLQYTKVFYSWQVKKKIVLDYVPQDISVELGNVCNFKCLFCSQSNPKHFDVVPQSVLNPDQAEIILRKLRQGGVTTDVIHWNLDGEPFLNQKINEIFLIAAKLGWQHFIFSTNGYFCVPEKIKMLPTENNVKYTLYIDYCADKELFEKDRGTPNSWERIKNNISNILNDQQLEHISITLTDISSFSFSDKEELEKRFTALKNMFPNSNRINFHTRIFHNSTGFVSDIMNKKKQQNKKYNLCPYPWTSMVIASNGDVVACCRDLEHKTVLGNLFEEDLPSIWNGEKYQQLRQSLANQKPEEANACQGCDLPYDDSKFGVRYLVKTGISRLGIFK